MAIGKSSTKTGFVGKRVRKTGPIGRGGRKRYHGSKWIQNFVRAKVNYPTTTT